MNFTGGILFSLLAEIKYDSPRAKRMSGNKDACSNSDLLKELVDLIGLETTKKPTAGVTSRFKTCEVNGAGNEINTKRAKECFDKRIKTQYCAVHKQVKYILEKDIINDDESRKNIVSILLASVERCENIKKGTLLYTNESGIPETASDLLRRNCINFPALILGLWHFTVSPEVDNREGYSYFIKLFENKGTDNTDYELRPELKELKKENLILTYDDSTAEDANVDEGDAGGITREGKELKIENPGPKAQTINFNFSVTGDNANVRNIINNGIYIEGDYNEK